MKVKALTTIETTHHVAEEDDDGIMTLRTTPISIKEGDIVELDDKLAARLCKYGHVSEDMGAETVIDRARREASEQQA